MTQTINLPQEKTIERAMRLFEAQSVLFAPRVSRRALLELDLASAVARQLRVNVWRNHSFESLVPLVTPYFAYGGWQVDFRLGTYDDTLMFAGRQEAEADLVWLDSDRFLDRTSFANWLEWLGGRLRTLRATTAAPIILATWWMDGDIGAEAIQRLADSLPAVYFADMGSACSEAGVPLLDRRSAKLAGTSVSNSAQLVLARKLGCHWLPAAILPPIKAVAFDLDHTLHRGVLGEDGIQGVKLTPGHAELQRYIKGLQRRGIFIAMVSRNERPDVEALFAEREDYPLRWDDFSAIEVSWGDKATAVERIATGLRIAPEAVLLVDDNPGELANVTMRLPLVQTIYAYPEASLTMQVLHFYPGLWRWKVNSTDANRILDLSANREREALAERATDSVEYLRSLQVALTYSYDCRQQLSRMADLCNKTNQFNLALRRFNQAELADHMSSSDSCVASIHLTDRFADSGIIGLVIAERQGESLLVEELCISCRAIGRQLEDTIILQSLRDMPIFTGCQNVVFRVQHGPRNQPALDWLGRLLRLSEAPAPGLHALPAQRLLNFATTDGVTVIKN